ncbi:DUF559 domain-containing protein [Demequina litorisediminis]|uniref:Restriction endonuclease type II-like domain-containing protein n=1 Tax=Demequina litorisediminis TaxID=1849022 RepID=A0ABQ6IBH6_9MICO|nr:hypothetical protein GCM10025876_13760 [Demequina litorisediminis]
MLTPGPVAAWLERHADGRAESVPETCARVALVSAGMRVTLQQWFEGIGRVDMVVEGRVVVECDGREYHSDDRAFSRDRWRDRRLLALGLPVMRFTYADAVFHPELLVQDVKRLLATRSVGPTDGC